jgi:hypothetical protein
LAKAEAEVEVEAEVEAEDSGNQKPETRNKKQETSKLKK